MSWLGLLLPALLLSACSHRDPQAAFDHAFHTLNDGDAKKAANEAAEGYKDFRSAGGGWAWKFTILKARALYRQGKYNEVLALLDAEPNAPASGELAVRRKLLQGLAYTSLHDFQEAERKFQETEPLCEGASFLVCADVAGAQGTLEMQKGHYSDAQVFFVHVLEVARVNHDTLWEANTLLDLSWSALEQTHFDEALDWADAANQIALAHNFGSVAQKSLGNMGWAYYKLGDREKAEGMFVEAAERAQKLGQVASQVGWLTDAGYGHLDAGDLQAAQQSFQQSLELAQQINSREDMLDARTALAFVSEKAGKTDDAKRYADEALAMARTYGNGEDVVYPLLIEGRIAARQHDTAAAQVAFRQVQESKDTPVFLKWEAERSLARLYEAENHPNAAEREYRTALSTFEATRCSLHQRVDSRLPFLSNAERIYENYIHFLVERGQTNRALQVADYMRARTLAEGLGRTCKATFAPDPLIATQIASRAGGTILFYSLGDEHSYLWTITDREVRLFALTASRSEIDAAVQRYRKKLEGPPEILNAANDGTVLYDMLVAPAQSLLNRASSRNDSSIFIIPDGALNSLNFETLISQPTHYWIEDVTIANAASLAFLPTSHGGRLSLNGRLLLLGNPVSPENGPNNAYPELPNAAKQIQTIEKYFPPEQQTVLTRRQASPAAYLNSHPEQFSYIHFVAHGTASRLNPLDSAIILSSDPSANIAANANESFKLYARDIITHPLHAQLVTISACYSTGKRTYSGEGLVGLSWAFLRSGAHNVIGALWDVSDASTSQLTNDFYRELKNGESPAEALRTAKLHLLHDPTFHSPFYWASFQLFTGSQNAH